MTLTRNAQRVALFHVASDHAEGDSARRPSRRGRHGARPFDAPALLELSKVNANIKIPMGYYTLWNKLNSAHLTLAIISLGSALQNLEASIKMNG